MRKLNLAGAAILVAACATLGTSVAFARGPGGPAMSGSRGGGPAVWQGAAPPGFGRGKKTGWRGGSVPPGWSKGQKRGWQAQGMPPGLFGR